MNASPHLRPLVVLGCLLVAPGCTTDGTPNPNGDPSGDTRSGDSNSGDPLGGDTLSGDPMGSDADMGDTTGDSAGGDEGSMLPPGCTYPIPWEPAPGAQAAAQADLTTLNAAATLTWSDARGTFTDVDDLDLALDCDSDPNIWTDLVPIINAHPDLFQMDLSEYELADVTCSSILSFGSVGADRHTFGNSGARAGSVIFYLERDSTNIKVTGVFGNYLPTVPANIQTAMDACPGMTVDEIRTKLDTIGLDYTVLNGCANPIDTKSYFIAANDMVSFSSELLNAPGWNWTNGGSGVELTFEASVNVTVHPSNSTADLESSNATCPNPSGPGEITGWQVELEMVLREILMQIPGLGCMVC